MNNFIIFLSGIVVGIYIDQSYKVPSINKYVKNVEETLKKHEKK